MAQLAERHDTYVSGFDAFRHDAAFGRDALARAREAAFDRFVLSGFPTTRDEEWRFTNVAPIAAVPFERAPRETPHADLDVSAFGRFALGGHTGAVILVVNGRVISTDRALPAGVTLRTIRDAHGPDLLPTRPTSATVFTDLSTAFFEDLVVLEIAPKAVVPAPLHVLFLTRQGRAPVLVPTRLVVRVGEQAQASLIESYADAGESGSFVNAVTDVHLAASARLDHVKLQRQSQTSFHLGSMFVQLGRSATFTSHAVTIGGRIARNDIVSVLDGDGAECTLNGLYVAGGESLVDTHTTIDHAQPHCPSHEVYRGILTGHARAVFNGKILVRPDAQKTDAKQTNKALLLTDDAQVNTKPQLEIFADDVKCTHGAAIGQLDEDALFYLKARGIGAVDARNMLIHAFAGDVLNGIQSEDVRRVAMTLVEETLGLPA